MRPCWFSVGQSGARGVNNVGSRIREGHEMTIAGIFITALESEQRFGNVSAETEQV